VGEKKVHVGSGGKTEGKKPLEGLGEYGKVILKWTLART
jgi:hypothetical protein